MSRPAESRRTLEALTVNVTENSVVITGEFVPPPTPSQWHALDTEMDNLVAGGTIRPTSEGQPGHGDITIPLPTRFQPEGGEPFKLSPGARMYASQYFARIALAWGRLD